ncbi:MAG TPA: hypothetical protein VF199_02585, partial [Bacillales bacterium]
MAQQLVNEIVTLKKGADLSGFFFLFTLQVLVLLFSFILQQLNQIKDRKLEYSFRLTIKKRIFDKIQRLPYITFEDPRFFNQFQRLNSGQSKILLMIREGMNFTKGIITLSGVLLLLITINWWLIPIL